MAPPKFTMPATCGSVFHAARRLMGAVVMMLGLAAPALGQDSVHFFFLGEKTIFNSAAIFSSWRIVAGRIGIPSF